MSKWRKKPVVVEAFRWTGSPDQTEDPEWIIDDRVRYVGGVNRYLEIQTLEGAMRANQGDYIIRGVKGELYPCKPDIFEATYEPV